MKAGALIDRPGIAIPRKSTRSVGREPPHVGQAGGGKFGTLFFTARLLASNPCFLQRFDDDVARHRNEPIPPRASTEIRVNVAPFILAEDGPPKLRSSSQEQADFLQGVHGIALDEGQLSAQLQRLPIRSVRLPLA